MSVVKVLSLIFLSVFLIFSGLVGLMGFHLHWLASFVLGLSAIVAGVLILVSINEYHHFSDQ